MIKHLKALIVCSLAVAIPATQAQMVAPKQRTASDTKATSVDPYAGLPTIHTRPSSVMKIKSMLGRSHSANYTNSFVVLGTSLLQDIFTSPEGDKMPYRYFVPGNIPPRTKAPLILFLHGLGEAGISNNHLTRFPYPLTFVQPSIQKQYPCFFIAPQHKSGEQWASGRFDKPSCSLSMAIAIVDRFMETYSFIDRDRIYVTGISSGGIGTWDAIAKFPGKFAAAVPISAGWDAKMLQKKQGVAVWAFYNNGELDFIQDVCDNMLKKVINMGGIAQITIYPRGGHNAWSAAYAEPNLPVWLFKQRRFRPF